MEWVSIQCVCKAFYALESASIESCEPLFGRIRYTAHLFKMLRFADPERWKACVYLRGAYYVDVREPMGRVSSAHVGQWTSFLTYSGAMSQADTTVKRLLQQNAFLEALAACTRTCMFIGDPEQYLPLLFLIFQEDLLELTMGQQARHIAEDIEQSVI